MGLRRAEVADAAAIARVHVASWREAYRGLVPQDYLDGLDPRPGSDQWAARLAASRWPGSGTLVADRGGDIVGFVHIGPSRDDDADTTVGEIWALYADPSVWSTGVGRALAAAALAALAEAGYFYVTLWVLDTNVRARRFYEAAGWRPDGAVKVDASRGFPLSEVRYRRPVGSDAP